MASPLEFQAGSSTGAQYPQHPVPHFASFTAQGLSRPPATIVPADSEFHSPSPSPSAEHLSAADPNDSPNKEERPTLKRSAEFSFSFPQGPVFPKKTRRVLTTISARREKEAEDLHILQMLQLVRTTRETCAAQVNYRLRRVQEIDAMRVIANREYEEAVATLKQADSQVEELSRSAAANGIAMRTAPSSNLPPYFPS